MQNIFFFSFLQVCGFLPLGLAVTYALEDAADTAPIITDSPLMMPAVSLTAVRASKTLAPPPRITPPPFKFTPQPLPAPATMWMNDKGHPVTLENYRGKYVLLNLWATFCTPCIKELPTLDKLHRRYSEAGLEVVAVALDGGTDYGKIKQFFTRYGIRYLPVHVDPNKQMAYTFRVKRLPTTFLINPKGEVIAVQEGAEDWFSPEMQYFVEGLIRPKERHPPPEIIRQAPTNTAPLPATPLDTTPSPATPSPTTITDIF